MQRRKPTIVLFFVALTGAAIVLPARSALAQEPQERDAPQSTTDAHGGARFGAPGHLALDDVIGFHIGSTPFGVPLGTAGLGGFGGDSLVGASSFDAPSANAKVFSAWLAPSFDVFLGDRFTLGARGVASYLRVGPDDDGSSSSSSLGGLASSRGYALGLTPRVGYVVPLGAGAWLWPKIGAGYQVARTQEDSGGASTLSRTFVAEVEAGLVLGLGPWAYLDLAPIASWSSTTGRSVVGTSADEHGLALVLQAKLGIAL